MTIKAIEASTDDLLHSRTESFKKCSGICSHLTLPVTFAVPYDPAKVRPNPISYSISVRVNTVVDGSEKLYYINDTRHHVFRDAADTFGRMFPLKG